MDNFQDNTYIRKKGRKRVLPFLILSHINYKKCIYENDENEYNILLNIRIYYREFNGRVVRNPLTISHLMLKIIRKLYQQFKTSLGRQRIGFLFQIFPNIIIYIVTQKRNPIEQYLKFFVCFMLVGLGLGLGLSLWLGLGLRLDQELGLGLE